MSTDLTPKIDAALDLIAGEVLNASKPIVLCSFGKDSIVLLDLCLSIRKMPVLFFVQDAHRFPEKYTHAHEVIQEAQLEAYTLPPQRVTYVQDGDYFELFHTYGGSTTGPLNMAMGCTPHQGESQFVCAVNEVMTPQQTVNYPWDVTFHGHKETDDIRLVKKTKINNPVSISGTTRIVLPIWNWTDDDVWAYIRMRGLPYDHDRYDQGNDVVNPDKYPTCFACVDTRARGQKVYCPVLESKIENRAQPDEWHAQQKLTILGAAGYASFVLQDPPAKTEKAADARWLQASETWPLFTISKRIFDDHVYVVVDDLAQVSEKGYDGLRRLRQEWIRLERSCSNAGIYGWLARTEKDNVKMLRCLRATGAKPYAQDEHAVWVKKLVPNNLDHAEFPTLREMAMVAMGESHA